MSSTSTNQDPIHLGFQSTLEHISSAFFFVQAENFQLAYSNAAAKQAGIQPGQYCYQVLMEQSAPCECAADQCWVRAYQAVSSPEQEISIEHPHCAHTRFGRISVSPLPCSSDTPHNLLFSVFDTRQLEQMIDAVQHSAQQYRAFFDQNHDAIFTLDLQGQHLAANQKACALLGYTEEEIIRLSYKDISSEVAHSGQVLQKLLAGETVPFYERKFKSKNGNIIPFEVNVELIRQPDGAPWFIQSILRDVRHRQQQVDELQAAAWTDLLTGLHNRRYFIKEIPQYLAANSRPGQHTYLLFMDLNGFKFVNDTYGHEIGDDILAMSAKRIRNHFRLDDLICRFGGDEFMALLTVDNQHSLSQIIERLFAEINNPYNTKKGLVNLSISIGAAPYRSGQQPFDIVFNQADIALYDAKKTSGSSMVIYSDK